MAFPFIFASLAAGVQPLSDFDTMFNTVGYMGTVFCTATGTNTIALSPITNMPTVTTYASYQAFGFTAAGTSTGSVTANVSGVGAKNVYANDGVTQLGSGSLVAGVYYIFAYNPTLNSGAGGFQSLSAVTGSGGTALIASSINGGQLAGLRNRIINGDMRIDQINAGTAQTITSSLAYTVDMFYALSSGANCTGQQTLYSVTGQYIYQFTGASGVTGITFGTRIESENIYDLAGGNTTLSVRLSNTLLTSVTWTAYYANSKNNFTTTTSIATGTFTVTPTPTVYSTQISLPTNAANGIAIVFSVGAQTSGAWTIDEVQLENGSQATPFERRPLGLELTLAQRYVEMSYDQGTAPGTASIGNGQTNSVNYTSSNGAIYVKFAVNKFAVPTIILYSPSTGASGAWNIGSSPGSFGTTDVGQTGFTGVATSSFGFSGYGGHWLALSRL